MADMKCPLFADANFPAQISNELRRLGYDVLTLQQFQGTSRPMKGLSDEQVLAIAVTQKRAMLTLNEKHFRLLHYQINQNHHGVIINAHTLEFRKRAKQIDAAIKRESSLLGKLIYVPPKGE